MRRMWVAALGAGACNQLWGVDDLYGGGETGAAELALEICPAMGTSCGACGADGCVACGQAAEGCAGDAACAAIADCARGCDEEGCVLGCELERPEGAMAHRRLVACSSCASGCADSCGGACERQFGAAADGCWSCKVDALDAGCGPAFTACLDALGCMPLLGCIHACHRDWSCIFACHDVQPGLEAMTDPLLDCLDARCGQVCTDVIR